ncbi:hypothetical protein N7461_004972 [Penicillium sp. DV-2018c]|nr:hypothetical protein N7461_004972 [Penicillium sp. DV-2018c]
MAKVAQEESSALSKLRSLTVTCEHVRGGGSFSPSLFLPLFRLPSLRRFCGHNICDFNIYHVRYQDPDNALVFTSDQPDKIGYSNVTEIHLKTCQSSRGFADFINAPKRLESFIYDYQRKRHRGINYPDMHPSRYLPLLSRHREALHSLTLTYDGTNVFFHEHDYFGSLAGFSALRTLRLPTYNILDWDHGGLDFEQLGEDLDTARIPNKTPKIGFGDVLPPSLETLILDGLELELATGLAKAFKDLLLGGKHRCPNLTYLEIKGSDMLSDQSRDEFFDNPYPGIPPKLPRFAECESEIEGLCLAAGIEFCFRDTFVEEITR